MSEVKNIKDNFFAEIKQRLDHSLLFSNSVFPEILQFTVWILNEILISKCPSVAVNYTVDSGIISSLERVAGDEFCYFFCYQQVLYKLDHVSFTSRIVWT